MSHYKKLPTMSGDQSSVLHQLLQALLGGGVGGGILGEGMQSLSDILSNRPGAFEKFEKPYMNQFQQQTIPGLAEQFSSLGSGAQGSSAFGQQLGAAGAGLSENLASMRGGMQQDALSQLMQMLQTGLGAQEFGYQYKPSRPKGGFLGSLLPGLMRGAGAFMGGMM